ncbi:MAG TPA: 2-oxoglutarate dehydrogenase complex dihydrolipoyllysine-residue succinyltransferase [Leptospiraceae bacterium]|nr:2-oxoglutarate dehydrogenase complex dihydrolipoyllysine-residue succinyltransferase [Leptospiraceae bacterium]HMW05527.1 2-oxoglutarate dehydrogenase complex dihydrolipoyllysine-residue succinyltransferase [Leptospiraceae bacterium]HMX34149.1 2-oxoglutarate dehydrogenase complex dihydrolipoyllysine-residue succinyltransferase [Leptospiraceae bacterium]HMY31037.1 2-oxoglutarate dehydrogenase complex dihydrolipoyllysine-residue succinyltransferase [Leptospiraceae bacterium]HMZ65984.1 2-oxoglu
MAVEIKVPEMGESITEATLLNWTKKPGEAVKADEILAELETDKVTMEVRSPASGVIKEQKKKAGETVSVREVIGLIEEGAVASTSAPQAQPQPTSEAKATAPIAKQETAKNETLPPSVKKMTTENGIDPSTISGTGKHGQVTKGDVIAHIESKPVASQAPQVKATPRNTGERETVVPMSRLRRAVADRLVTAQHTAAILTTFNEIDMSNVMNLRSQYKDKFKELHNVGLGFMSFFTKAAVAALKAYPAVNAEIRENDIVYKNYYDIGIAVGGPKGLVVPIVRDADQLSFAGIESEIVRLAGRVKDGKIALEEMQGGTFSISNGGTYGSMMSTPILNYPQVGILGLHNIVKRPVVVNDQIVIRPMMYVALSYDHRIIDGKEAVLFLVKIKEMIEDPTRLLIEV